MLGRQLKLRLVAEEGQDIPRSCTNIVVSIHAIATFQAFNDYLRPRIISALAAAERLGGGSSGRAGSPGAGTLSSLLAAFAAAAARADGEDPDVDEDEDDGHSAGAESEVEARTEVEPETDTPPTEAAPPTVASSSSSSSKPQKAPSPTRRRSSRLSGKGVEPAVETESESKKEENKAA